MLDDMEVKVAAAPEEKDELASLVEGTKPTKKIEPKEDYLYEAEKLLI